MGFFYPIGAILFQYYKSSAEFEKISIKVKYGKMERLYYKKVVPIKDDFTLIKLKSC